MMLAKKTPNITIEELMSRLNQQQAFEHYIGKFTLNVGRSAWPLRKDKRGTSFTVYMMSNGRLGYKDFADDSLHGGIVDLVMHLFSIDKNQAIRKIADDMGIVCSEVDGHSIITRDSIAKESKHHCLIQVTAGRWSQRRIEYWENNYGLTIDTLRAEDVYVPKEWSINRKKQLIYPNELIYVYRYPEGFQVYMPERPKKDKWRTNLPLTYIEGWDKVDTSNEVLFTKSKKDKMYLQQFIPFPVMRTINESVAAFTPDVVNKLKGKRVWINMDNDRTGKESSWKVCRLLWENEIECKHLNVPDIHLNNNVTDFTDWRKHDGHDENVINHLKVKGLIT